MHPQRRRLALAAVRFTATLTALLVPWPGFASKLVRFYVHGANLWLSCLRAGANVRLFPGHSPAPPWTAQVFFRAVKGPVLEAASLDVWRTFHLPISVFLALCLAHRPRRARHVLPMAVLGTLFLAALPLASLLEHAARLGLLSLPAPLLVLLVAADRALWSPAGMAFIVPGATWLMLLWSANQAWASLQRNRSRRSVGPRCSRCRDPRGGHADHDEDESEDSDEGGDPLRSSRSNQLAQHGNDDDPPRAGRNHDTQRESHETRRLQGSLPPANQDREVTCSDPRIEEGHHAPLSKAE